MTKDKHVLVDEVLHTSLKIRASKQRKKIQELLDEILRKELGVEEN